MIQKENKNIKSHKNRFYTYVFSLEINQQRTGIQNLMQNQAIFAHNYQNIKTPKKLIVSLLKFSSMYSLFLMIKDTN